MATGEGADIDSACGVRLDILQSTHINQSLTELYRPTAPWRLQ